MLIRAVVGDEIDDDPDLPRAGLGDQGVEVSERALARVDIAVVSHVIAAVGPRGWVEGRQPDGVDAERGEVVQPRQDPAQVPEAVAVGVGEGGRVDLVDDGTAPPWPAFPHRHLRYSAGSRYSARSTEAGELRAARAAGRSAPQMAITRPEKASRTTSQARKTCRKS